MGLLSTEFLSKYPEFPAHMNQLGRFIYYRTYSRWLEEKKRRETWKETCIRAVEYNFSLVDSKYVSQAEAEEYFDNMFNLRQFLSGRTLWVGGTSVALKYPMANFNCAFMVCDDFETFKDAFYALMVGTGFGFRILKSDVEKMPTVRTDVRLTHAPYLPTRPEWRQNETSVVFRGRKCLIQVGDSKEGWVQALDTYFRIFWDKDYRNIDTVEICYNDVRPKGERLKTFGGTASGHESLKNMFTKIHDVFTTDRYAPKPKGGKLRPIHCLDIMNIIGENVVVGGVRRTSEIALIDADDKECVEAKLNLTPEKYHRFMSNNSIFYETKPSRDQLAWHFATLYANGEPGFVNAEEGRRRRENFNGLNPCAEILLDSRGLCNLTTLNAVAFVKDGKLDFEAMKKAAIMGARAGLRMTCVTLELHKWDAVQKRDRLIGCSMTGWKDAMEAIGATPQVEHDLKLQLKTVIRQAADEYADQMAIPRPLLATTIKPEGTLSQLAGGVSPGLHHSHAEYFIRRIRINAHDPLCKLVEAMGWVVNNEVGQGILINDENRDPYVVPVTTKVIDFPVHSPAKRTEYDVTAKEQFETYLDFQDAYTEHNSSNTIKFKDEEWAGLEQMVFDNWDKVLAITFLKVSGHTYELAPYEQISREEYERRVADMRAFNPEDLAFFENGHGEDFDQDASGCEGGACPIR